MRIDIICEEIIELLRNDTFFSDKNIIGAYPSSIKPTRLNNVTVSVGIEQIDLNSKSIDEKYKSGDVKLFLDIFVPSQLNSVLAQKTFINICRCIEFFNIKSVSAERLQSDKVTQCYLLKSAIVFNDCIEFGGVEVE